MASRSHTLQLLVIVSIISALKVRATYDYDYRLPRTITPVHYHVKFDFDASEEWVDSSVEILLVVNSSQPVSEITLHSHNDSIRFNNCSISSEYLNYTCSSQRVNASQDLIHLDVTPALELVGLSYLLVIEYQWKYRARVERLDQRGPFGVPNEWHLLTQMETTYARRLFPCFDEPDFKAQFAFSVNTLEPPETSALALFNTFNGADSPIMSSYLVALAITNATTMKDRTAYYSLNRSLIIRIFGSNATAKREYARIASRAVHYYESTLNMKYQLEKLDFAVSSSFRGGMENYGLIVVSGLYKELFLHEVAHAWFGNLVTMKWWNDIWLNEGLTTYYTARAYTPLDLMPGTKEALIELWLRFVISDSLLKPHQALSDNEWAKEFQDRTNSSSVVVYLKGSVFANMVAKVVGETQFDRYMGKYLQAHKGGNVDSEDFVKALPKEVSFAGKTIDFHSFLRAWITTPSFPIVNITHLRKGDCVRLTQHPASLSINDSSTTWAIPIFGRDDKGEYRVLHWFDKRYELLCHDHVSEYDWSDSECWGLYLLAVIGPDGKTEPPSGCRRHVAVDQFTQAISSRSNDTRNVVEAALLSSKKEVGREKRSVVKEGMQETNNDYDWAALSSFLDHLFPQMKDELWLRDRVHEIVAPIGKYFQRKVIESYYSTQIACMWGLPACVEQAVELSKQTTIDIDYAEIVECTLKTHVTKELANGECFMVDKFGIHNALDKHWSSGLTSAEQVLTELGN